MEQSCHPPPAAAERAALRSARSSARANGSSGSAGCGAELFLYHPQGQSHPTTAGQPYPFALSRRIKISNPIKISENSDVRVDHVSFRALSI
jgi:hypothetical protein